MSEFSELKLFVLCKNLSCFLVSHIQVNTSSNRWTCESYQATTRDPSLGGLVSHIKHHLESGISKAFPQPSCDPSIHSVLHPEFISKTEPVEWSISRVLHHQSMFVPETWKNSVDRKSKIESIYINYNCQKSIIYRSINLIHSKSHIILSSSAILISTLKCVKDRKFRVHTLKLGWFSELNR